MALIQATRQSTGGGGGGLTINGFANDQSTVDHAFAPGDVVIPLSQTPVAPESIEVDMNGQRLLYNGGFSYDSGTNSVIIEFEYLYDDPNTFQITYAY